MIEIGRSYMGDELRELAGNEGSERVWAFAFEREGKDIIVVCEDEGNDNWKVLSGHFQNVILTKLVEYLVFLFLAHDEILRERRESENGGAKAANRR